MSVSVNGETPSSSTDESAAMPTDFDGDLWRQVEGAIAAGFQLASAAGPLAEEPMHGICFLVESVKIQQGLGVVVTRGAPARPLSSVGTRVGVPFGPFPASASPRFALHRPARARGTAQLSCPHLAGSRVVARDADVTHEPRHWTTDGARRTPRAPPIALRAQPA